MHVKFAGVRCWVLPMHMQLDTRSTWFVLGALVTLPCCSSSGLHESFLRRYRASAARLVSYILTLMFSRFGHHLVFGFPFITLLQEPHPTPCVPQLLTCMDSLTIENTGGKPVVVIGATNRPNDLDSALRRAGRFDREICLGVPDLAARARILQASGATWYVRLFFRCD